MSYRLLLEWFVLGRFLVFVLRLYYHLHGTGPTLPRALGGLDWLDSEHVCRAAAPCMDLELCHGLAPFLVRFVSDCAR